MMEGVMQFGTGRRISNYGVEGEIAGKTGTTNDNSDAWFIGYTPQLLCGAWTGCDDRFIRFNSTAVGQGSSLALPIWAYFYSKASADKNLVLDTKSTFVKPDVMTGDFNQNWVNTLPENMDPEGHGGGNGDAGDYGDTIPKNLKPRDIAPESEFPSQKPVPTRPISKPPSVTPPAAPLPKAVMPKKPGN
jgi:penicillin-binding protein 1A